MKNRYIVYNCGYHSSTTFIGKVTGKKYKFVKKMVTEVDSRDEKGLLDMTSKDVPWCPVNNRSLLPFMNLEDWCAGKEGRFDFKPFKIYDPKKYKKVMLVE
jgi:hypothetical protein